MTDSAVTALRIDAWRKPGPDHAGTPAPWGGRPPRTTLRCAPGEPEAPAAEPVVATAGTTTDGTAGTTAGTLAERKAVADTVATRYAQAGKQEKSEILDQVCAVTGWHRSHARKALLRVARPQAARPPRTGRTKYDADVVAALTFCWKVLDRPAGKRLAPVLPELVPVLRRHGELDISDETAELLMGMSAATIDRRLAEQRQRTVAPKHIRAGSLLRNELPLLNWAEWDHTRPGFMEITVVRHDGDGPRDGCLRTVTVTDIATGWSENRTIRNVNRVPYALDEVARILPFPMLGLDSGNSGSEAEDILLDWCGQRRVTFTHARPTYSGNHHVGQKNWSLLQTIAGDYRYDTTAQLILLNQIWAALSTLTNYFYPQQHSVPADEDGGPRRKEYDTATPYRRTLRHHEVTAHDKAIVADTYVCLNPADLYRRSMAMTDRLHLMAAGGTDAAHQAALPRARRRAPGAAS
ncbi:hypothetical protein ABZW67_28385 [Streptomyces rubiginosohelvolus]|uniref:hypothetical protein n=1 Tax=Streptomyces rubiginosohelvolus TaxID=67362 RepID=UPI0033B697F6